MAAPFSSTTSVRSVFQPNQNSPLKHLLSFRDYNGGLNCVKCGSSTAHLCSWKSASNYVRLNPHPLMLSTQLSVSGNLLNNRRGVVRAATIEEIEAEKTLIEKDVRARMEKTIDTVRSNFNSIRTGRASPAMLDKIEVEYYGNPVGPKSIAQISTPDASSLLVQPYDKSSLKSIEKAIVNSDLGLTPNNDGEVIRLTLPQLTSERRKIVGGKTSNFFGDSTSKGTSISSLNERDWVDFETDLYYWTKALRPVQWYPGHIAKTEKELKNQLKLMDVVIEVRDARIPLSTSHPQMDAWLGTRRRILVLNREDMISSEDRNAWAAYFTRQGIKVVFSNGQLGMGTMKLGRLAKTLAADVNVKRRAKGLLPRAVRAGIVGYPNVGKSSLINRLLKRRMCPAAPRPGVTRELKWVHFGKDLELLDSPGIIPMRISDQAAAIKLAICDDIGERSYNAADIAAILVQILTKLPSVGVESLQKRYKVDANGQCGHTFVQKLAVQLFNGDNHQAAFRILSDFRKGKFGWVALERPPR